MATAELDPPGPLAMKDQQPAPKYPPTGPEGLTDEEAAARRAAGDGNNTAIRTGRTYWDIVRSNLFTFINTTLIIIGIILVALGQPKDAILSSGLAVINALVGIVQEIIAKRRLDEIALLTRAKATVIRDGQPREVDPEELVLGDLVAVGMGDQVLLDGELTSGELEADESLLTGEADLVKKTPGDQVFSGSFCVTGSGRYVAEKVGEQTLANSITAGARAFRVTLTPLQRDVNAIVKVLLSMAVFMLALVLVGSVVWDVPLDETVIGAAVILGIVPSGLFLMITVTYSMASVRLARENALVQQVNAVESLSNVAIFCADKTGTLTANKLNMSEVQAIGFDDEQVRALLGPYAASVTGGTKTSDAIAEALPGDAAPLTDEIPFSSARKWSAVAADSPHLKGVFAIGAPEMLAPHLDGGDGLTPPDGWAEQGLRVLLFAYDPEPADLHPNGEETLPATIRPAAWLGFGDELRPNLPETLEGFRQAGVQLKIISGDNPETVAALAKQAGFGEDARLVSGLDLAKMSDGEFNQAAAEGTIFGRITPEQKERIVNALREQGNYVAMTGDGVNDVLSLKKADLGIAMQSGSQATRGVADIVLLNDSFAAVPAAFREGQRIRRGLQDVLDLFLVRVFVVALLIFAVIFIQGGFPFAPANMSLLTILTVGIPTFSLVIWSFPGRAAPRIIKPIVRFTVPATVTLFIAAFTVYVLFYFLHDNNLSELRNMTVKETINPQVTNALARDALTYVMILAGLWLVVFVAPPNEWWAVIEPTDHDWRPTIVAAAMLPVYALILWWTPTRNFFNVNLLDMRDYIIIFLATAGWALLLRQAWKSKWFDRFYGYENYEEELLPELAVLPPMPELETLEEQVSSGQQAS